MTGCEASTQAAIEKKTRRTVDPHRNATLGRHAGAGEANDALGLVQDTRQILHHAGLLGIVLQQSPVLPLLPRALVLLVLQADLGRNRRQRTPGVASGGPLGVKVALGAGQGLNPACLSGVPRVPNRDHRPHPPRDTQRVVEHQHERRLATAQRLQLLQHRARLVCERPGCTVHESECDGRCQSAHGMHDHDHQRAVQTQQT